MDVIMCMYVYWFVHVLLLLWMMLLCLRVNNEEMGKKKKLVWISDKWRMDIYSYAFARVVVFVLHQICLEEVSCCQVANWVHQKKGHLGCETKWDKASGHKTPYWCSSEIHWAGKIGESVIHKHCGICVTHASARESWGFIVTVFTFEQSSVVRRPGTWSIFDNQRGWYRVTKTLVHTQRINEVYWVQDNESGVSVGKGFRRICLQTRVAVTVTWLQRRRYGYNFTQTIVLKK